MRYGPARTETINGREAGETKSLLAGPCRRREEAAVRSGGAEEKRERSSAPRPAPRTSRRQLADWWNSESCERAPYIEPGSRKAAEQSAPGGGD